jgi:hypothetical protein
VSFPSGRSGVPPFDSLSSSLSSPRTPSYPHTQPPPKRATDLTVDIADTKSSLSIHPEFDTSETPGRSLPPSPTQLLRSSTDPFSDEHQARARSSNTLKRYETEEESFTQDRELEWDILPRLNPFGEVADRSGKPATTVGKQAKVPRDMSASTSHLMKTTRRGRPFAKVSRHA